MKRVLTAVVLIPLVLLVVFRAPLWLFSGVVGLVVLVCLREYLGIVKRHGIAPSRWVAYAISILLIVETCFFEFAVYSPGGRWYLSYLWPPSIIHWATLLLAPLMFGIPVVFRRDLGMALAAAATTGFGVFYVAIPLTLLIELRTPGRRILIVFVLLLVWAGDIAAYLVGKSLGRHKLAPIVSPNKTWEGAIASLVAGLGVAILVFRFHEQLDKLFASPWTLSTPPHQHIAPAHVIAIGVITNVAAQLGDLFESAIKRGAQVKDSGSLLPGHGGMLDRIDALLFAIPTVWYYALLTGFLPSIIE